MAEDVLRESDSLIVTELDHLGRNKRNIMQQIRQLNDRGIRIMVLELPTTLTDLSKMENNMAKLMLETINNMMLELYASMAEAELHKKEKRQREGSETKRLRGEWGDYGWPVTMCQENFNQAFQRVISNEITPTELRKDLKMTHATFYRYRKKAIEQNIE